jgi:hypothetical protein
VALEQLDYDWTLVVWSDHRVLVLVMIAFRVHLEETWSKLSSLLVMKLLSNALFVLWATERVDA